MADAAVSFAIERLGDLLIAEVKFLHGVKGRVEDAKVKLEGLRCFLKDANAYVRDGDQSVRFWVAQIRESAHALEDVIETFVLKIDSPRRRGSSLKNMLKRFAFILIEVFELHKVGSEIGRISTGLSTMTSYLQTYGVKKLIVEDGASSSKSQQQRELRRAYSHVVEQDAVGLDKDIEMLVEKLTKSDNAHRVVAICGMGGLGKTTLARKVYHHPRVRSHFDRFAWASISQQCEIRDVWEGILINLTSPTKEKREEITKMRNDEIAKEVYNIQKNKKCLVLLDDIWTASAWDRLLAAFPKDGTNSKILLTTRLKNVASHVDNNGLIHEPRCLDENESWELFEKKSSFGKRLTDSKDHKKMQKLGQEMLKQCAGLPLAILVLSGLLSTKCTIDEWEILRKNVKAYINKGKGHDGQEPQGVMPMLCLSYDELPYHLKPCFLHLAHFPEDHEIKVKQLCNMWIAEGFIPLDRQTQSSMVTVEDVAYDYLSQLVERNMIQVGTLGSTGRMKSCRIHDLMRDVSLSKAQEENFMEFVDLRNRQRVVESSMSSAAEPILERRNKVRRLAIYAYQHFSDLLPYIISRDGSLRSLIFIAHDSNPSQKSPKAMFNHFRLLRVLRLERVSRIFGSSWKLPKEIGNLIHLRLLSLLGSYVKKIPSSIGNLRCLLTLDVNATVGDRKVPNVIWRLEQLRHLYLPLDYCIRGTHLRLSNVGNFQTLYYAKTEYLDVNDFFLLTKLKKLALCVDNTNLERLYHNSTGVTFNSLRSLNLHYRSPGLIFLLDKVDITPVISCCPQIRKLKMEVPITKLPDDNHFSPNLIKLSLGSSGLEEDPMRTFEKLPNLRVLSLCYRSYIGNEMVCSKGGFPELESLCLDGLSNLKEWRVEEGALPRLHHLTIASCYHLRTLPDGLRFVTTLKELKIEGMSKAFKKRTEEGGEDFYKVQHVPSLVFLDIGNKFGLIPDSSTDSEEET